MSAADKAIRVTTALAVLGVAGIAAYVSYQHALEVVRAHGESGITARLEPATIDGLVYSSSMVVLYAARHRLPVPALARWLLALGIVATLAANVAHGWSHGPVGAAVAAWPAASLVGSYELLLWLIRTAAVGTAVRKPDAGQPCGPADHPAAALRLRPILDPGAEGHQDAPGKDVMLGEPDGQVVGPAGSTDWTSVPDRTSTGPAYRSADHETSPCRSVMNGTGVIGVSGDQSINQAAASAYLASVDTGRPLSERRLAAMFGKTSRRWARNRIAEAREAAPHWAKAGKL